MRMRSRCSTRMHGSSKFSSLLSTLAQEHASAAVHRCEPAASGPGQQVAAWSGCAGTASRLVNQRNDPLLGNRAREGIPRCRARGRLHECGHHDQQQLAARAARRAMWHAGARQPAPQQGRIRPAQEARARAPERGQRCSQAGATCCVTAAARTGLPRLHAAQQQRHRAVHQQRLQPLLRLRAERARVARAQRVVRVERALYAVQGLEERAAVRVGAACRRAARLAPGASRARAPGPGRGRVRTARSIRARAAALGQRLLHDADEQIAAGGAAKALQVRGVRGLAGQAQPVVHERCAEQVLRQTGAESARGPPARAAGTAARGRARLGG